MTLKSFVLAVPLALLLSAPPGLAADEKPGRFTMSPADGGFVRLDQETGEMAFCKRDAGGGWACEAMPDSQMAMRRDMDRLRQENEALKKGAPSGMPPSASAEPDIAPPGGESKIPIPTEQDVDKLFDYVEGMAKKLKERLKRLEEEKPENKGMPL